MLRNELPGKPLQTFFIQSDQSAWDLLFLPSSPRNQATNLEPHFTQPFELYKNINNNNNVKIPPPSIKIDQGDDKFSNGFTWEDYQRQIVAQKKTLSFGMFQGQIWIFMSNSGG